jgi:hypothetical protein
MKKINVIDLDKTLIPYDSFRYYVMEKIRSGNIKILIFSVLRKLRLLSASEFKRKVILQTSLLINNKDLEQISLKILNSINSEVYDIIIENTDNETINILCSASPDAYVKKVAEHFNWIGYGSYFNGIDFCHMWGENKLRFIESNYPSNKYIYNFAISDSEIDLQLLKTFNKYKLLKR